MEGYGRILDVFIKKDIYQGKEKINMKKWETPKAVEEQFTANSNVSACYSLVCVLPGDNPYIDDGDKSSTINQNTVPNRASYNAIWGEREQSRYSEIHDSTCASPARYNKITGVFKGKGPYGNAELIRIKIDTKNTASNDKYPAIWTSHSGVFDYNHMGYATDESVGHPNRS